MAEQPMSFRVARRLSRAAQQLGTADPVRLMGPMLDRTFYLPEGDRRYASNDLTPGAAPIEPSYSELEPGALRFTIEPLGPEASGTDRRDEATREMRRLVRGSFGRDALHWFDEHSEEWRGLGAGSHLKYGAFFGTGCDPGGLYSSKVYYETSPRQMHMLPRPLFGVVSAVLRLMPNVVPLFTTIACRRESGGQRLTFLVKGALRLTDLGPLLDELGLGSHLPRIMQVFGLALGGRFELPDNSTLIAVGLGEDGPEFELYVLLGMIPDVPANFLDLLAMGLTERPRELQAMLRWLGAFTPETAEWPGNFSVLSVRTSPQSAPRVSLYLRPVEFEITSQAAGNGALRQEQPAA
jgi:hypothetical protein